MKLRIATQADIKAGNVLYDKYGSWVIISFCDNNPIEIRGNSGSKILFANNIHFYEIELTENERDINDFNVLSADHSPLKIGSKDLNNIDIKELDVISFKDKGIFFVEYCSYNHQFMLRNSLDSSGRRKMMSGGIVIGCILNYDFKEPIRDFHNSTSTYSKWSSKKGNEAMKSMGII